MKTRVIDLVLACILLVVCLPLMALIFVICSTQGSPLLAQERLGINYRKFKILKFRTMRLGTPLLPSHKVCSDQITPSGRILRKYKLDELPQLVNIILGDMSFVGPRPCLETQHEVILERAARGVFSVRPGLTGLAQISGVDMSNPKLLAELDQQWLLSQSARLYFSVIYRTIARVAS